MFKLIEYLFTLPEKKLVSHIKILESKLRIHRALKAILNLIESRSTLSWKGGEIKSEGWHSDALWAMLELIKHFSYSPITTLPNPLINSFVFEGLNFLGTHCLNKDDIELDYTKINKLVELYDQGKPVTIPAAYKSKKSGHQIYLTFFRDNKNNHFVVYHNYGETLCGLQPGSLFFYNKNADIKNIICKILKGLNTFSKKNLDDRLKEIGISSETKIAYIHCDNIQKGGHCASTNMIRGALPMSILLMKIAEKKITFEQFLDDLASRIELEEKRAESTNELTLHIKVNIINWLFKYSKKLEVLGFDKTDIQDLIVLYMNDHQIKKAITGNQFKLAPIFDKTFYGFNYFKLIKYKTPNKTNAEKIREKRNKINKWTKRIEKIKTLIMDPITQCPFTLKGLGLLFEDSYIYSTHHLKKILLEEDKPRSPMTRAPITKTKFLLLNNDELVIKLIKTINDLDSLLLYTVNFDIYDYNGLVFIENTLKNADLTIKNLVTNNKMQIPVAIEINNKVETHDLLSILKAFFTNKDIDKRLTESSNYALNMCVKGIMDHFKPHIINNYKKYFTKSLNSLGKIKLKNSHLNCIIAILKYGCCESINKKLLFKLCDMMAKNYCLKTLKAKEIAEIILDKYRNVLKHSELDAQIHTYILEFVAYGKVKSPLMDHNTYKDKLHKLWLYLFNKVKKNDGWRVLCNNFSNYVMLYHYKIPHLKIMLYNMVIFAAKNKKMHMYSSLISCMLEIKINHKNKPLYLDALLGTAVNYPTETQANAIQKIFYEIWYQIQAYHAGALLKIKQICLNNLNEEYYLFDILGEYIKNHFTVSTTTVFMCFEKISKEKDLLKVIKKELGLKIIDTPEKIKADLKLASLLIRYLFDKEPNNLIKLLKNKSSLSPDVWQMLFSEYPDNIASQEKIISIVPKDTCIRMLLHFVTNDHYKKPFNTICKRMRTLISREEEMKDFLADLEKLIAKTKKKKNDNLYSHIYKILENIILQEKLSTVYNHAKSQQYQHIVYAFINNNPNHILDINSTMIKLLPDVFIYRTLKNFNSNSNHIKKLLNYRLPDCFYIALQHHHIDCKENLDFMITKGYLMKNEVLNELNKKFPFYFGGTSLITDLVQKQTNYHLTDILKTTWENNYLNLFRQIFYSSFDKLNNKDGDAPLILQMFNNFCDEDLNQILEMQNKNLCLQSFEYLITKGDFKFVAAFLTRREQSWLTPEWTYMRVIREYIKDFVEKDAEYQESAYNLIKILANNHAVWVKETFPSHVLAKQFSFIEIGSGDFFSILLKTLGCETYDPQIFNFLCSPCVKVEKKLTILKNVLAICKPKSKYGLSYNKALIQIMLGSLITPFLYANDPQVGFIHHQKNWDDLRIHEKLETAKLSDYDEMLYYKYTICETICEIYANLSLRQKKYDPNDPLLKSLFELFSCNLPFKNDYNSTISIKYRKAFTSKENSLFFKPSDIQKELNKHKENLYMQLTTFYDQNPGIKNYPHANTVFKNLMNAVHNISDPNPKCGI